MNTRKDFQTRLRIVEEVLSGRLPRAVAKKYGTSYRNVVWLRWRYGDFVKKEILPTRAWEYSVDAEDFLAIYEKFGDAGKEMGIYKHFCTVLHNGDVV